MARKCKHLRTGEDGEKLYLINEVSRMVNLSQKRIREYEKEVFFQDIKGRKYQQSTLFSN